MWVESLVSVASISAGGAEVEDEQGGMGDLRSGLKGEDESGRGGASIETWAESDCRITTGTREKEVSTAQLGDGVTVELTIVCETCEPEDGRS